MERQYKFSEEHRRNMSLAGRGKHDHGGKKNPRYSHGMAGTKIYYVWFAMKKRCDDRKATGWKNYGGRGIEYCEEWKSFQGFWNDMRKGYREGLTIERIENDGDYCKENCKWATRAEQNRNSRNVKLGFEAAWEIKEDYKKGVSLEELRRKYGVKRQQIYRVINGIVWQKK